MRIVKKLVLRSSIWWNRLLASIAEENAKAELRQLALCKRRIDAAHVKLAMIDSPQDIISRITSRNG